MENIMEIQHLDYQNILKNIHFSIQKNSFVAISGNNKSGKTTLMRLLCGIEKDNKNILFEKAYLSSFVDTELYQKIGFVFLDVEVPFLFHSVEQELVFILDNLGYSESLKKERYRKMLKLFDLKKETLMDPHSLSYFAKIKVLLALAVIRRPQILILDDICRFLSREERYQILDLLKKCQEEETLTIVLSCSHLEETLVADFLYILNHGSFVLSGKPLQVLKNDSELNKMGLTLPFMVDLSLKLAYYDLVDDIELDMDRLVMHLWT